MTEFETLAGVAEPGKLYGIGVGPGDVRYMTLRAAGLVRSVDVLAYFAKRGRMGNARKIVAPLVAPARRELKLEYPLTDEVHVSDPAYGEAIARFYRESAETLKNELGEGRSVGLLAEGDPFFYGSFMHMWRRLEGSVAVEVVPGVTGMSGCWTRANTPMTWGDDVLSVVPGTLSEALLVERLTRCDAAVIMKVGRNLAKVRRAVETAGMIDRAIYIERGTMSEERIMPLRACADEIGPYFAMVIIPGNGRRI